MIRPRQGRLHTCTIHTFGYGDVLSLERLGLGSSGESPKALAVKQLTYSSIVMVRKDIYSEPVGERLKGLAPDP